MHSKFGRYILESPKRIPLLIGVYAGLEITGASVLDAVSDSKAQTDAVMALQHRFSTDVLLTAMDLSAEAELFGCQIKIAPGEIPTVIGRKLNNASEIEKLEVPQVGDGRTAVHLDTASNLVKNKQADIPVIGGVIGPFSLAGRLFGVSEALELSLTNPILLKTLLFKSAKFISQYVSAFRQRGANGVIIAEPAAGLLSPKGLGEFSSIFIKEIVEENQRSDFTIILHNCGAKIAHLPKILEAGAEVNHFGAPMNIGMAIHEAHRDVILAGNLDPTTIFHDGSPSEIQQSTLALLQQVDGHKNFIPSSGCDIPPGSPLDNLDIFYKTVRESNYERKGSPYQLQPLLTGSGNAEI